MRRSKLSVQIVWVGLITLLLTIFATMILPLVRERSARRDKVLSDLTRIWGQPHLIAAPVAYGDRGLVDIQKMRIDGEIKTSTRRKGIYRFPFYSARIQMHGVLSASTNRLVIISRSRLQIERAKIGNRPVIFSEQSDGGIFAYTAKASIGAGDGIEVEFTCEGLQSLTFVPTSTLTEVRLKSDWNDPGFFGDYLPTEYEINKSGFNASWKIHMPRHKLPEARTFHLPTSQVVDEETSDSGASRLAASSVAVAGPSPSVGTYGVNFYQPVNLYLATERSVKYAILFIALTFLTLVLFETISSAEIHPMQYLMAGSALVIFYLLLLALAEYTGFTIAYIAAAGANVLLLAKYSGSFLLSRRHTIAFASVLTLLYSLLYVILQLEEFALIAGASTLFLALAATMYLTRKLDWYRLSANRGVA